MKRILITGKNSYIGLSVEEWLKKYPEEYEISSLDLHENAWTRYDFSDYDVIFHVAGIAHADVGNVSEEVKKKYYAINTDLTIEVAKKAKRDKVKQFIFMSSMIVYSGCNETWITKDTKPQPLNFYGDSKLKAEEGIRDLESKDFRVVVLRPPMIYGRNSKGNFPRLAKLAMKTVLFPRVENRRSMLYIDNLCEFVRLVIDNQESGIFYPQNREYSVTSELIQLIATANNHRVLLISGMNGIINLIGKGDGKIGLLTNKVFGDSCYAQDMSEYKEEYRVYSLKESIEQIYK